MRNAQGYAVITDPDGIQEQDTFTCFHCNAITHVQAGGDPTDLGGLCKQCMRLICPRCVGKPCRPFEKWLDKLESRLEAQRTYGF